MSGSNLDVVLLGVGHTNAHVLREWRARPLPHARLFCVSDHDVATYSGMLSGVLAGEYPPDAMAINLRRFCDAAGAQLEIAQVTGLNVPDRQLVFADRPPLGFDVLSIGVGSVPSWQGVDCVDSSQVVQVKPMQTFLARLHARLRAAIVARGTVPLRIVTVGGGAGGVEVTLCLPAYLRAELGANARFEHTIVCGGPDILPGSARGTVERVTRIYQRRGVEIIRSRLVTRVDGAGITLDDGARMEADVVLWATGAAAPPVLSRMGLPTDAGGFLLTKDTLQSTGSASVFAVGDTGSIDGVPTPKAGVYAVRQGPVLWSNLQRMMSTAPLRRYAPQRTFLRLVNTGDGRAIGEWRGISFEGVWCRRLKDIIDRGFVGRYRCPQINRDAVVGKAG
jgi:pyridine nucleotide-disulfide oxidoreductase family protein